MAQTTSAAWKAAQKLNFLPQSFVEISYFLTDPNIKENIASVTSTDVSPVVTDLPGIMFNTDIYNKYASLDLNEWALDGSFPIYNGAESVGYISNSVSNTDGDFLTPPTIDITFPEVQTSTVNGITVRFSTALGEMAREFTVTALNGGTPIFTETITANTDITRFISSTLTGYDEVQISIAKWCLPNAKARIECVVLGEILTFTNTDLTEYKHENHSDLLSLSLPTNQITFSVNNVDGDFDPANPNSKYYSLSEKQEIVVRYGLQVSDNKVEWIKGGVFFTTSIDVPQNGITATFTARDIIAFMDASFDMTPFPIPDPDAGKIYKIVDIMQEAFLQGGITTDWYDLDASFANINTRLRPTSITEGTTCAEVLQYCANALCAVMYFDRDGILHIISYTPVSTGETIEQFNSYGNANYDVTPQLKAIDLLGITRMVVSYSDKGVTQIMENRLAGIDVLPWARGILTNRIILSGEYRPDVATDPLDYVVIENKYGNLPTVLTDVTFTFNGAFRGNYIGRAM